MCESCFSNEYRLFPSFTDHEIFINLLKSKPIKKIDSIPDDWGKFKFNIFGFRFGGKFQRGYDIYECESCHTKWIYSEPDYAWRGYFKKYLNNQYSSNIGITQ
jgi:hypothetical protein